MGQDKFLMQMALLQLAFSIINILLLVFPTSSKKRKAAACSPGNKTTEYGASLSHERNGPFSTGMSYHASNIFVSAFYFSPVIRNDRPYPVLCA